MMPEAAMGCLISLLNRLAIGYVAVSTPFERHPVLMFCNLHPVTPDVLYSDSFF